MSGKYSNCSIDVDISTHGSVQNVLSVGSKSMVILGKVKPDILKQGVVASRLASQPIIQKFNSILWRGGGSCLVAAV